MCPPSLPRNVPKTGSIFLQGLHQVAVNLRTVRALSARMADQQENVVVGKGEGVSTSVVSGLYTHIQCHAM